MNDSLNAQIVTLIIDIYMEINNAIFYEKESRDSPNGDIAV